MTKVVDFIAEDLPASHPRRLMRTMSQDEFVTAYGSGTLNKSAKLGFNIYDAYLQERARFEFGTGFEIIQRSRVTYCDIKLVPCQAMTELGWHAERMIELRPFESDDFICKSFEIEYSDGKIKTGAGILVWETSAPWVPAGYMVLSVVAEQKNGVYKSATNPF